MFTVGGQSQIIVSLGVFANQFLFPQSHATSWRLGTTAHLGLVRAKDTRPTKLGSEENRGAPPHLQLQPVNQNQGLLMWSATKFYRPKLAGLGLDLMSFIIQPRYITHALLKLIYIKWLMRIAKNMCNTVSCLTTNQEIVATGTQRL